MNKRTLIGILVNNPIPLLDYEYCEELKVDLIVFNKKGINWKKREINGFVFHEGQWEEKTCPFPSAIYNRRYNSNKSLFNQLEKAIGKDKVFNCITKFDKWKIASILQKSKVSYCIPATYLYHESILIKLLQKYDRLILKPCKGYFGREVYRIEKSSHNGYLLYNNSNLLKIKTNNKKDFLEHVGNLIGDKRFVIQEFITFDQVDQKIYDIRIYVQKDEKGQWSISGGFSRVSFVNSYITNMASTIKDINDILLENNQFSLENLEIMKNNSLYVAKIIEKEIGHLGEIAVDFALSQGKPWIIEINGKTQKSVLKHIRDAALTKIIYMKPIQYAIFLASKS